MVMMMFLRWLQCIVVLVRCLLLVACWKEVSGKWKRPNLSQNAKRNNFRVFFRSLSSLIVEVEVCDVWELNNTRRVIIKLRTKLVVVHRHLFEPVLNDRCKSADTRQRSSTKKYRFQSRHNLIHSLSKGHQTTTTTNQQPAHQRNSSTATTSQ